MLGSKTATWRSTRKTRVRNRSGPFRPNSDLTGGGSTFSSTRAPFNRHPHSATDRTGRRARFVWPGPGRRVVGLRVVGRGRARTWQRTSVGTVRRQDLGVFQQIFFVLPIMVVGKLCRLLGVVLATYGTIHRRTCGPEVHQCECVRLGWQKAGRRGGVGEEVGLLDDEVWLKVSHGCLHGKI